MPESPLYPLLNEINRAVSNGMPFLAVAMTVALPDICASLASADGRTNGPRYRAWCSDNLPSDQFGYLTADDLYSMRCGVLHNGRFGGMSHSVKRVFFLLPGHIKLTNVLAHGEAFAYSVVEFCNNFTTAVYNWMETNKNDEIIKANIPRLMQYREGGLPPYLIGPTVLA